MAVKPSDIGWASYRGFEGPFWRGSATYRTPQSPSQDDLILTVITATEGGRWDSYNGYDRCRCTSGLIQWCEHGQYSVSDMLGEVAKADRTLLAPLDDWIRELGVTFEPNARGRWRFRFADHRGFVDRSSEQIALFCGDSTGHVGTWGPLDVARGKGWAAAISSVWHDSRAQQIQKRFTVERLRWFVRREVRTIFDGAPATPEGRAFQAAYLSFAANNPTWAARHLQRAALGSTAIRYSADWLAEVLRELTFGPQIAIYPDRYDAIRPVLERHFGVDLPDVAADLEQLEAAGGGRLSVTELQEILDLLGYDLGPAGIDGIFGPKTRAAVVDFQVAHGLQATGDVGPRTRDELLRARDALDAVDAADEEGLSPEERQRIVGLIGATIARSAREAVERSREER